MDRDKYSSTMGRGRNRWGSDRNRGDSPSSPRSRFRNEKSHWEDVSPSRRGRDRRHRSPHSPSSRKRMHSRSDSRSRSRSRNRSRSGSPRKRRNYSRSASPKHPTIARSPRVHLPPTHFPPPNMHNATSYPYGEQRYQSGVDSSMYGFNTSMNYSSGYENYYQHQPPPSIYPPGVPDYVQPPTQVPPPTMQWTAPDYPPPTTHNSEATNASSVPFSLSGKTATLQQTADKTNISIPPPPGTTDTPLEDQNKKDAIAREAKNQKENLLTQREEYIRKAKVFERELGLLCAQQVELTAEDSRDTEKILRENRKLQVEIQNKLKAIHNVIDMLTGIIGDSKEKAMSLVAEADEKKKSQSLDKSQSHSTSSSPGLEEQELTVLENLEEQEKKVNYIHYDPENHWCRVCNVFPRTAKEYLHHLHSSEHKERILSRKLVDMPWHETQTPEEVPHIKGAPSKRTPIKGLQFFISVPAWYCKLCSVWIGDLHCASLHLKSSLHASQFANFAKENPNWEKTWLGDRERALEENGSAANAEDQKEKREKSKNQETEQSIREKRGGWVERQDGREKKHVRSGSVSSSGSGRNKDEEKERYRGRDKEERRREKDRIRREREDESETDRSKSIRVAMRNRESKNKDKTPNADLEATNAAVPLKSKWDSPDRKNGSSPSRRPAVSTEDRMIREWLPVEESESDMLSNLKDRMKKRNPEYRDNRNYEDNKKERFRHREKEGRYFSEPQYGRNKFTRDVTPPRRRNRSPDERSRWDASKLPESPPPHRRVSEDEKQKSRDRDRDREKGRDRDRDREHEYDEEGGDDDEDSSSKKKKKRSSSTKTGKMPFIGKMPVFKNFVRKKDDDMADGQSGDPNSPSNMDISPTESPTPTNTVSVPTFTPSFVSLPPVTGMPFDGKPMITASTAQALCGNLSTPTVPSAAQIKASIQEYKAKLMDGHLSAVDSTTVTTPSITTAVMPKSTLILSKTPPVSLNLPVKPKETIAKMTLKKLSQQFMEGVQAAEIQVPEESVQSVPMDLEDGENPGGLSKDFQDALQIIFPDNSKQVDDPDQIKSIDADVTLPDLNVPPPNLNNSLPNMSNPPPPPGMIPGMPPMCGPMGMDGMYQAQMGMPMDPMMCATPMGVAMDGSNAAPQITAMGVQPTMTMGMNTTAYGPPGVTPAGVGPPGVTPPVSMYEAPPGTNPLMYDPNMYMQAPLPMHMQPPRMPAPKPAKSAPKMTEDDLAMLGIDADDVGTQDLS